jgi:flavin reductase (DIM6/NTAB) family NADH-FMN oxidoreductase RutF
MIPELKLVEEPALESAPAPDFLAAMGELASGVVLVTCRVAGRPWGMTVSAFTSVSADPAIVLVSLRADGTSATAIKASRRFAVNILADDQEAVARRGSAPGAPKFVDDVVIAGALAHVECELVQAVDIADHTVLFGRVVAAHADQEGSALVYHRRAYRTVADLVKAKEMTCLSS